MFDLSEHIIDEAMEIAKEMSKSGAQVVAIGRTGLFVIRNVQDGYIEIHEIMINDTAYIIAQRK